MPRRRRATPEWIGRDPITVATLPGRGLYARHLGNPEGVDCVHRPTVPIGDGRAGASAGSFDPRWLAANADAADVVHVLALPPQQRPEMTRTAVLEVKRSGKPLVVTLYHLSDPAGPDSQRFDACLDALVPQADRVITLTERAAEQARKRWPVEVTVLPHPHVVGFVPMRAQRRPRLERTFRVGAHFGSLRFAADPVATADALSTAVAKIPGATLEIDVHNHVLDPDSMRPQIEVVKGIRRVLEENGGLLRVVEPMTDSRLWEYLRRFDASFVPPLFGSHSIWPEACFDLGLVSVMAAGSLAAGQQPGPAYEQESDGTPEITSLVAALQQSDDLRPAPQADGTIRWQQRVSVSESLRTMYEGLTGISVQR